MKAFAKFLTVVTVLAALAACYIVWASDARVSVEGYRVESAADRPDSFAGIVAAARAGEQSIELFSGSPIGDSADQYVFVTYTLRVRNMGLVPFEWLELSLDNQEGDILLVKPTVSDVPALNQSLVSFTLMLDRNIANYERSATFSYYAYGHYKEFPLTLR